MLLLSRIGRNWLAGGDWAERGEVGEKDSVKADSVVLVSEVRFGGWEEKGKDCVRVLT